MEEKKREGLKGNEEYFFILKLSIDSTKIYIYKTDLSRPQPIPHFTKRQVYLTTYTLTCTARTAQTRHFYRHFFSFAFR